MLFRSQLSARRRCDKTFLAAFRVYHTLDIWNDMQSVGAVSTRFTVQIIYIHVFWHFLRKLQSAVRPWNIIQGMILAHIQLCLIHSCTEYEMSAYPIQGAPLVLSYQPWWSSHPQVLVLVAFRRVRNHLEGLVPLRLKDPDLSEPSLKYR